MQRQRDKFVRVFTFFSLLVGAAVMSQAVEFSADMVMTAMGQTSTGKVYVKGDKMRTEASMQGMKTITIADIKQGTVLTLMPAQRAYMEIKSAKDMVGWKDSDEAYARIGAKRVLIGTETINGYKCEKYRITFKDPAVGTMTQWYSKKLSFAMKVVHEGPMGQITQEFKNVKKGNVSDAQFKVPEGYRKIEIPNMGMTGS